MQEKARIERPKSVSLQLLGWSDKNALLSSIARVPPPLRHPQPQHPRYERTLHSRQTKSCRDFKFYHYDDPRGYIIQYRRDCSSNSVPSNADGPLEMFMNLGVDEHSEKEKCRQEWRCEFLYKCQEQKERSNRRAISGAGHTLYTLEDDNITTAEADGVGLDYRESTKFDTGNIKKAQLSSSTSTQTLNKFVERTTIGSIRPTYRTQLLIPEEGGKDEAAKMDRVSSNMSNYLDLGRDPKRPTNKVSCDKVCGKDKAVNLAEIPSWTNASAMWSHKASFRPPGKIVPRTVRLQSSRPSRAELSKKKTLTSTVARSARYNAQESLGHQQAHKDALAEAQLKLDKVIPQTKRTCTIRDASDPAFARVLFTKLLHLQQEQSKMGDDYSPIRWKTREKSSLEGMSGNSTHEKSIELHKNLEVSGRPRRVLNTDNRTNLTSYVAAHRPIKEQLFSFFNGSCQHKLSALHQKRYSTPKVSKRTAERVVETTDPLLTDPATSQKSGTKNVSSVSSRSLLVYFFKQQPPNTTRSRPVTATSGTREMHGSLQSAGPVAKRLGGIGRWPHTRMHFRPRSVAHACMREKGR